MAMARFAHNKKIDEDNMRDLEQNTLTGAEETKLQYDYIEKAKSYIKEKDERERFGKIGWNSYGYRIC